MGHKGYGLIPPSKIDDSEYKPFTNCTIKEISKTEYDLINQFFLLDRPIQMRKPFRDILNGEIEIEEYATKHNKKEFVYWKFLFREAYHFCKLTPEEIFSFLKKNQDTFSITKTNHQLNYNYHSYKGRILSNEKLKEYFPDYSSTTSCFNGDYSNNKSPDFTLYGLHSYLSKFHSKYKFTNQVLNKKMLSQIHSNIVSLLLQIEEISSHIGCCDSCGSLTKTKSVNFKNPNGKLLKINECKECFESDWNMEWESYIENRIILHQK